MTLRSADQISSRISPNRKTRLIVGAVLFSLMMTFLQWPRTTDAAPNDASPVADLKSSTEPGYQHTHLLITDGEIQGFKTRCVLDTGATTSLVDASLTARFAGRQPPAPAQGLLLAPTLPAPPLPTEPPARGAPAVALVIWDGDEDTCSIRATEFRAHERVCRPVCRHMFHA